MPLLRFLRALFTAFLAFVAFISALGSLLLLGPCISYLSSEKVYDVDLSRHEPHLDGCLVRAHVSQIRAGNEPATEHYFGVTAPGAVLVASEIAMEHYKMPPEVEEIASLTGTYAAPQVYTGVFELTGIKGEYYGGNVWKQADASQAMLMPGVKALTKRVTAKGIELTATDEEGKPYCISFRYAPAPHEVNLHIIARQQGTRLEVQKILRGEEEFRHATRLEFPFGMSVSAFARSTFAFLAMCVLSSYGFLRLGRKYYKPLSYYREHPIQKNIFNLLSFCITCGLWLMTSYLLAEMLDSPQWQPGQLTGLCLYALATMLMAGATEAFSSQDAAKARLVAYCTLPAIGLGTVICIILSGGLIFTRVNLPTLLGVAAVSILMLLWLLKGKIRRKRKSE